MMRLRKLFNKLLGRAFHDVYRQECLILDLPVNRAQGRHKRPTNYVSTARYTLVNYLPKCTFEQFRNFVNIYFLVIIILAVLGEFTNMYETPYSFESTLLGLSLVVGFTMALEGYYDIKRHRTDFEINKRPASRLRPGDGLLEEVPWASLMPGDVVKVSDRSPFPADLLFVTSCNVGEKHKCYVETAGIDGETNLKIRRIPPALAERTMFPDKAASLNARVAYEQPHAHLSFTGSIRVFDDDSDDSGSENFEDIPLDTSNILLRGCVLRNTPWILGIVLYAGKETTSVVSSKETPTKMSKIQKLVNRMIIVILVFLVFMCAVSSLIEIYLYPNEQAFSYFKQDVLNVFTLPPIFSNFFTFAILYSGIVPISLIFCVTFSNFFQALFVNSDPKMFDEDSQISAKCNTIELVQELGQVNYLFSDKTGTLTRNEMKLVGLSVGGVTFGLLSNETEGDSNGTPREIMQDVLDCLREGQDKSLLEDLHQFFLIMSLCHTVLIDPSAGYVQYYAEGPDEEALVNAAADLGFRLISRDDNDATVNIDFSDEGHTAWLNRKDEAEAQSSQGISLHTDENKPPYPGKFVGYQVLAINHFNSNRRRMSVICRMSDGRIVLLMKGADASVFKIADETQKDFIKKKKILNRDLDNFACHGLRTLVFGTREISPEEYIEWKTSFDAAHNMVGSQRTEALEKAAYAIERDVRLIGASAIEDRLQEGVPETLVSLREAGVKTWLITGDKVETAINIAFSSQLFNSDTKLVKVVDEDPEVNMTTFTKILELLNPKNIPVGSLRRSNAKKTTKKNKLKNILPILSQGKNKASAGFYSVIGKKPKGSDGANDVSSSDAGPELTPPVETSSLDLIALKTSESTELSLDVANTSPERDSYSDDESDAESEISETEVEALGPQFEELVADDMVLVITGAALANLLKGDKGNEMTESRLLALARLCSVVVACAVSPKQKALIVRMVKLGVKLRDGSAPVTMAIGDGANDVAMIQEADVGVGIDGREGRQAANSSDFSVSQFRFLQDLMLVHGRWNYRRISTVVLYVFYANIVFIFSAFAFSFYTKFSGSSPYFSFLNLFFAYPTQLPIVASETVNQDISRSTALAYPAVYVTGRENQYFNIRGIATYLIRAFWHVFIIVSICLLWGPTGAESLSVIGTTMYLSVIWVCLGRACLETYTWTWLNSSLMLLGFTMLLVVIPVYYSFDPDISTVLGHRTLFRDGQYSNWLWSTVILTTIMTVSSDVIYSTLRREFFPSNIDRVIEIDRCELEDRDKNKRLKKLNKVFRRIARPLTISRKVVTELLSSAGLRNVESTADQSGFAFDYAQDTRSPVKKSVPLIFVEFLRRPGRRHGNMPDKKSHSESPTMDIENGLPISSTPSSLKNEETNELGEDETVKHNRSDEAENDDIKQ